MAERDILAARAASYLQQTLDAARGPGGMLIAFMPNDTRRPLQEGADVHWYLKENLDEAWGPFSPKPTVAEWYYGENTLWATGWLLYAQMLRYQATQEPEALAVARKCFRDLNNIFRLGWAIEPGLLGKPHGGRAGPTTSFDQAANPVLFYTMFALAYATPEEKAIAAENMAAHGDYYLRRNWVMNHHGNLQRIVDPAHTSTMKYLACVHAAYDLTGEVRFRDAAFKYLRQLKQLGRLPFPSNPYETNHNLFYYALLADYWLKTGIADEADWRDYIRLYWKVAKTALGDDGLMRKGMYDTTTDTFTPYPSRWMTPADVSEWPGLAPRKQSRRWVSPISFLNRPLESACMAWLGLLARAYGFDDTAHELAQKTLLRLDDSTMRWGHDGGDLPAELRPVYDTFGSEVPGIWLVAYWFGRVQGVW